MGAHIPCLTPQPSLQCHLRPVLLPDLQLRWRSFTAALCHNAFHPRPKQALSKAELFSASPALSRAFPVNSDSQPDTIPGAAGLAHARSLNCISQQSESTPASYNMLSHASALFYNHLARKRGRTIGLAASLGSERGAGMGCCTAPGGRGATWKEVPGAALGVKLLVAVG